MSVLRWPEMKTEAKIKIVSPFVQFVAGQIQASTLYTRVQNNRTPCVIDCMSVKTHGYSVATRRRALDPSVPAEAVLGAWMEPGSIARFSSRRRLREPPSMITELVVIRGVKEIQPTAPIAGSLEPGDIASPVL